MFLTQNYIKTSDNSNTMSSQTAFFIIEKFLIALRTLFKSAYSEEYIF